MFHVKHEGWPTGLPEAAVDQLERYLELLRTFALPRGLIAGDDAERLRERHVEDGLRALPLVLDGHHVVDLGSGAGLPGIPLAIGAPHSRVVLAEARRTRAAFLELAVEQLHLPNASVHAGRVEALPREFDLALARGFGDAAKTWGVAADLLLPGGRLAYWAGKSFDAADDVPADVRFDLLDEPGLESRGPIVIMARQ